MRASAKASAAPGPISDRKPAWASSMLSTPSPLPWNSAAAITSIRMFTIPARLIAITTSQRWKRRRLRRSSSSRAGMRSLVSAECR